ncbi:Mov34/MPN/PAD-1 family protein [Nostoc commune]|uniref:Mov34/MPN/PAD-1 family protein n=1 Tax=Nostoc commune TaxID=1178 RepID=UPI0018C7DD65|nr:M67 family metallopeptidase [Nostoc commune]MBG1262622.1 M67 family metallopeptidase [Nostoc commune BAE]
MIQLTQEHLQTIRTHAESTYPEECCGIILGYLANGGKIVVEVIPTENAWNTEAAADFVGERTAESKRRQYAIAPEVMLKTQREARDRSLNIIGIFHSHPVNPAIPSECDRLYAWQGYSYIIVSVQNGKAGKLQSWSLDETHHFQAEAIENII